ncbi:MAG: energy transducer TonB [Paludibacter sp.]|nr:energy transducer TonB [Paludibacter sp.]
MTDNFHDIENRSRLVGSGGSFVVITLLFLLLFFTYLPKIQQHIEEEGILVSFGDSYDGGGTGGDYGGSAGGNLNEGGYATQQIAEQPIAQSVTQSVVPTNNANNVATQDDHSGAYAQQQAAEAARQKAIADAQAARVAEQQRQQQAAIDKANRLGSALAGSAQSAQGSGTGFGSGSGTANASGNGSGNGTGSGSGVGTGDGNGRQGNPAGRGNPNGSWSLQGRELVKTSLPIYNSNIEGKITVAITVNSQGIVVSATIGKPTTISDNTMRNDAIAAAKKAVFSTGTDNVNGTITYDYKLN